MSSEVFFFFLIILAGISTPIRFKVHLQGPSQWVDVMKKKRAIHEQIINLVHQKRSTTNPSEEVSVLVMFFFPPKIFGANQFVLL